MIGSFRNFWGIYLINILMFLSINLVYHVRQEKYSKEIKEEKINALNRMLIKEGRMDDLIKATSDYEYQKKLIIEMEEKGII